MTEPLHSNQKSGSPVCSERQRLQAEFLAACHDLNSIQSEQITAVIAGDPDFTRFDDLMHMAREKKDHVKYAMLLHIEEHGC